MNHDDGLRTLDHETREQLDQQEAGITAEEREKAVANLRVLVTAHARCTGIWASLDDPCRDVFAEPYDSDGFFVTVQAPEPGDGDADGSWEIEVGRWEPDDPEEEYGAHSSATGSTAIRCALPAAPTLDEITGLLNFVGEPPKVLAEWADTRVGAVHGGRLRGLAGQAIPASTRVSPGVACGVIPVWLPG